MGLFSFLKPKKQSGQQEQYAYTQSGVTPSFSKFGDNVYKSDTVQQAINAIAKEMKKLDPQHIRSKEMSRQVVNGNINRLLHNPNELMTTSDFIEKIVWLLYINYNCYIYPTYEIAYDDDGRMYKTFTGLYPLNPQKVTYYEDNNQNPLYVKMEFSRNRELTIRYNQLIHLRLNYALNDYEGGDQYGRPNNEALLKTLKINHVLLENVGKSIETSYSVNGIVKYNTMLGGDKTEKALEEFNAQLKNSESGILGLDMKAEYTPITRNIQAVNNDTLKFLDLKVLRNYGVPIEILDGTATPEQRRAFYEGTLEPLIVMMNQAFTKCMFSPQQINSGNKIVFYYNRMETMTTEQKQVQAQILGDRGAVTNNFLLELFGYPPYEGGDIRMMSLNYVNVDIANQYQLSNAGAKSEEQTQEDKPQETYATPVNDEGGELTTNQEKELMEDVDEVVKKPLLVGQIQALTQIIADYQAGAYTYNQALNMLIIGVGLTQEEAEKLLDKQDNTEAKGDEEDA